MTTRIGTGGAASGVVASQSAARVTAPPAQPFRAVMSASANAILSGAEQAVTQLPGGPILAAALRPGSAEAAASTGGLPVGSAGANLTGAALSVAPEGSSGTAAAGAGSSGTGVEAALSQSANQNLYFIEIQERISAESRSYSAISNVLKARHDTVKNAIGNIR